MVAVDPLKADTRTAENGTMNRGRRFSERGGREGPTSGSGQDAACNRELYAWLDQLRQKRARGESLTERELMCLQMVDYGFGCAACATQPAR